MKYLIVFALLICGVDYISTQLTCRWTGCEGWLRYGQDICDEYGFGQYNGKVSTDGCTWDTSKVECCKASGCLWSTRCYGIAYGGNYVCSSEFGGSYHSTGQFEECPGVQMSKYYCCP